MSIFNIFPERATVNGYPDNLQYLGNLKASIAWLNDILPLRKLPNEGPLKPLFMKYEAVTEFQNLCTDVLREAAHNDRDYGNKYASKYDHLDIMLSDCIKLFEENSDLMEFDMSFLKETDIEYYLHKMNWYKAVYDWLLLVQRNIPDYLSEEYKKKHSKRIDDSKTEPGGVRYQLLIECFSMNEDFKNLTIEKHQRIIGKILGQRWDTVKGYINKGAYSDSY